MTTYSDILLMRLARGYRRKPIREFKAYLLHKGITREPHVDEKGEIEEVEAIAETIDELLKT